MPLTPKNRKEEWLEGFVEHETTLTPKNREEEWLKEIIDASGGGGGGDIDLGITGASVGEYAKIKTVDADGAPTAWESGSGVLLVVYDADTYYLDKTWQTIFDAMADGMIVLISSVEETGGYTAAFHHIVVDVEVSDNDYLVYQDFNYDNAAYKATSANDYPISL